MRFLAFFAHSGLTVAKTWFVFHETWHTTLFGIYYLFEVVRIENHCHMLEITSSVEILFVFKLFLHFRVKVA